MEIEEPIVQEGIKTATTILNGGSANSMDNFQNRNENVCQNDAGSIDESKMDLSSRTVKFQVTPIFKHLKTSSIYILAGDILVDLNFGSSPSSYASSEPYFQFSAMNWFKNLTSVESIKGSDSSEMGLTISQDSLFQFPKIIEILENYPDSFAHEFGQLLRQYQFFISGQQQKAKFLASNETFQQMLPMFEVAYEGFLTEARQFVQRNIQKNPYQFYQIVRANPKTFTPDISRIGLSNQLCALLGGSSEQLSWLVLHCGLFEFFSKETRNQFYFAYLSRLLNRQSKHIEKTISLVTVDGIELQVNYELQTYFGENAQPNVIFFYPHMLILISFEIPSYMQKNVEKIRVSCNQPDLTPFQRKELQGDVAYQVESQVFLETHYADLMKKGVNTSGGGIEIPKEKRKYQKHPKSQHQIDFRIQNQTKLKQSKQKKKDKNGIQDIKDAENTLNGTTNDQQFQEKSTFINSVLTTDVPWQSQNIQDYAMLNVASFNQNNISLSASNQIPQKIVLSENISVYPSSQYANHIDDIVLGDPHLFQQHAPIQQYQMNNELDSHIFPIIETHQDSNNLLAQSNQYSLETNQASTLLGGRWDNI